jgi:hypothetical protein
MSEENKSKSESSGLDREGSTARTGTPASNLLSRLWHRLRCGGGYSWYDIDTRESGCGFCGFSYGKTAA